MLRIAPLPEDAVSQLHSSKHITSLEGVVIALLENSLDSGASKVEVTVNFRRGACTVEDNGFGIPTTEFGEDGGLGKPYHTSKHGVDGLHGHAGLFLSSLGAVSLLMISSLASGANEQATVILHQGRVVNRHVPSLPVHRLHTPENRGTKATVRDLFGNMPVRIKQRDLNLSVSSGTAKMWQILKLKIVALLLAWPKGCAIRLLDGETDDVIMVINGSRPGMSGELTEKALENLEGKRPKLDVRDSLSFLFQGRLVTQQSRYNWIPVSAFMPQISLRGTICLDPSPNKQTQFINIGIHHSLSLECYEAVNKVFAQSRFPIEERCRVPELRLAKGWNNDQDVDDGSKAEKQPRTQKRVDKWPMFIFHLQLKDQDHKRLDPDNLNEGLLKLVVDILEATVTKWLTAHNFKPRNRKRGKDDDEGIRPPVRASVRTPSPRLQTPDAWRSLTTSNSNVSRPRLRGQPRSQKLAYLREVATSNQVFDTWSRIKAGRTESTLKNPTAAKLKPRTTVILRPKSSVGESSHISSPPAFNVGDLDGRGHRRQGRDNSLNSRPYSREQEISSDDFGSVDEEALLACEADIGTQISFQSETPAAIINNTQVMAVNKETKDKASNGTDPNTKRLSRIISQTGIVLPSTKVIGKDAPETNPKSEAAAVSTYLLSKRRPISLSKRVASSSAPTESKWFSGFLKEWNNPVFTKQCEEPVRLLSMNDLKLEATRNSSRGCETDLSRYFGAAGAAGSQKLSKAGLKRAQVIRQVDGKFILCRLASPGFDTAAEVLALVDQHAVSERILLETLLSELCAHSKQSSGEPLLMTNLKQTSSIETALLEQSLSFEISEEEKDMFTIHAGHFARWGIMYDLFAIVTKTPTTQLPELFGCRRIIVRALPPVIAERCSLVPSLLIDLLRSEVWAVGETPRRTIKPPNHRNIDLSGTKESHGWLADISSCPQGLLDMIKSRACRSAIMFNDQLSVEQCQWLLDDVSNCAFPFICAHGRVSMVPLLELKDGDEGSGLDGLGLGKPNESGSDQGVDAYMKWMARS
ncbi:Hypothetical protein R9X50_00133600 [Acrodontium crateriforme]|uniref:MutL C-terminal dimerisation domain-containing protein n=1 Tax=Acrodontium crateriforme TaxID=150365 RepID=A0AAQ3R834_9PEZI|nr:Hypothetical protein R9X50_00133600 [Acrodontium crateriforme]